MVRNGVRKDFEHTPDNARLCVNFHIFSQYLSCLHSEVAFHELHQFTMKSLADLVLRKTGEVLAESHYALHTQLIHLFFEHLTKFWMMDARVGIQVGRHGHVSNKIPADR